VPPGDRDGLGQALLERSAAQDTAFLADARRAHARRFSWQATAGATLAAYERACDADRRR
jgi:hypothetical protein